MSTGSELSAQRIADELKKLRKGVALARPATVLELDERLREHLLGGRRVEGRPEAEALELIACLRRVIDRMNGHERGYVEVDFNLVVAHSRPTLTERQESMAVELRCAAKTIRRRSERALATLALLVASSQIRDGSETSPGPSEDDPAGSSAGEGSQRSFWNVFPRARVDVVCSEIPEEERPYFASPSDRNYLRYAKFADLDTLIYVRTRLAQLCPEAVARDFAPSEYHDADADTLIVIGGPPWNAKYREFLPQLPFHFAANALGEDDPLVVPQLDGLTMGPRWSPESDLLEDLAVFTRITLVQGTTVYLLGGCLTLGVLGAAKLFLQGQRGVRNSQYVRDKIADNDFVLVTEARRMGGITDTIDLETAEPLLLLARSNNQPFHVVIDNTKRYPGVWASP